MDRPTVLVVDDEVDLVEIVAFNLRREHYDVLEAHNGEKALELADRHVPDLVILDLMLPGINGLEVCRRLRANPRTSQVPILMLTAKGEETDAVIGLSQGADDYVRKPFGVKELMARVAAQVRRRQLAVEADDQERIRFGELVIDGDRFEATLRGDPLSLTATEFRILQRLATRPGRVYTRDDLMELVPVADDISTGRTIDVHVSAVRRKLGDYGRLVLTVRGVGYKLADSPDA